MLTYSLLIYPQIKRRSTSLEPYAACQVWLKFAQWFETVVNVFVHYYLPFEKDLAVSTKLI